MPEIHPKAINPFAPACSVQDELGVCGDAVLMRKGFLYRLIRFNAVPDRLAPSVEPVSAVKSRPESDIRHPKNDETALQASHADQGCLELLYSGWWFVQRIRVNEKLVWWAISWKSIQSSVTIDLTKHAFTATDFAFPKSMNIEIDFTRALRIRRFRVWVDQELRYEEIC